jgi:hypothetical protein
MKINNKSPNTALNIKKCSLQDINSLLSTFTNDSKPNTEVQFNVTFEQSNQTPEVKKELDGLEKKYPKWYGHSNTRGACFESERIEPLQNNQTEIVKYKTDRYAELFGRGKDCSYFPGYGKIFNRTFEIWYREVGSKDKQGLIVYKDIGNDTYEALFFAERITNGVLINNKLERTLGYLKLYNSRDDKNNKTWYAGLKDIEFTGIITEREAD